MQEENAKLATVLGNSSRFSRVSSFVSSMVEPMGFETTNCIETKEFCGALWPC